MACTKAHNEPPQRQTSLHIPRRSCNNITNIDILLIKTSIKFVGRFQNQIHCQSCKDLPRQRVQNCTNLSKCLAMKICTIVKIPCHQACAGLGLSSTSDSALSSAKITEKRCLAGSAGVQQHLAIIISFHKAGT